ncbi:MAG: NAD(P)/FAD-dependent oxidoreductase [Clostridiales bacterium]|jgi:predicted Rossmann fold flavoprotein|nr:NAD(P)/FAD-dependent oxidoreductase [Clostridiales bacterium]
MRRVIVIGGGAAGMMAAGTAAENGAMVLLLEKNEKLGKKLHITGKGRCNITNDTDVAGLLEHTVTNSRFLNSAFHTMDSRALMEFFASRNLPLKTERGNRVFPESDKADDVNKIFISYLNEHNVKIKLNTAVKKIKMQKENFFINDNEKADAIIIATGGLSYPATGSTGDGYGFAKDFGHGVSATYPALVPLVTGEKWVSSLEGLSLRNVRLTAKNTKEKILYEETGELLFTRNGVTGPTILRASTFICDKFSDKPLLFIDLKPALSSEQLDARILRDFSENQNKNFANALDELLPKRLIETIIFLSKIPPEKKVNTITRVERQTLVNLLKALPLTPIETAGFKEAVITKGGVNVREINPSTLMSKKIPGLFFAGEVLDVDAMTGGYNLQIAFSTGRLAGLSAAEYMRDKVLV